MWELWVWRSSPSLEGTSRCPDVLITMVTIVMTISQMFVGTPDSQVPEAHLFFSLSLDLPHKTEMEKKAKKAFNSYLTNPHQATCKVSLRHGTCLHIQFERRGEKRLGTGCQLFLVTSSPKCSFLAEASRRVQQMAQLQWLSRCHPLSPLLPTVPTAAPGPPDRTSHQSWHPSRTGG